MEIKKLWSTLVLSAWSVTAFCQGFQKEKVDSLLSLLESKDRWMGSLAIAQRGQVVYSRTLGWEDMDRHIRSGPETRYRVGSITKMFTTALTLKAIEQGRLKLDTRLSDFYPQVENAGDITISMLLQHRSGIHSITDSSYLSWNTRPITAEALLDKIVKGGSEFKPDSFAEYSNSNFILLTWILEKIYQKSFKDLVGQYITTPLGMKQTYTGGAFDPQKHEALSYLSRSSWEREGLTDMSIPLGAGNLVSRPEDLLIFINALFAGKIIGKESVALMQDIRDGYGRGMFEFPYNGRKGYGHTGGIDAFTSVLAYFPDGEVSVALTCNGSAYEINDIVICALASVYNDHFDMPGFREVKVDEATLRRYEGDYVSADIPLGLKLRVENGVLLGQGTGQPSFPLDPVSDTTFEFLQAGVRIEIDAAGSQLVLKQGGKSYLFKRKK